MTTSGTSEFIDYYDLLGVLPSADIPAIRQAFIQKAKEHHPDAGGATADMQQLNAAYKTLMSPTAKGAYDMLHSFHNGTTQTGDYKYHDGREVQEITDMTDAEIDSFLDDLLAEYRHSPPKSKLTIKKRIKKLFEL